MIFAIKITLKILKGIIKAIVLPIKLVVKLFQRSDVSASDVASSVPNTSTTEVQEQSDTDIASETNSEPSETSDSSSDTESITAPSGTGSITSNYYDRFYMGLFAIAGLNAVFIIKTFLQYGLSGAWWKAGLIATVLVPSALGYWVRSSSNQIGQWNIAFAYTILLFISSTFNQFISESIGFSFILPRPRSWMLENLAQDFIFVFFSLANYAAIIFVVYSGFKIRQKSSTNARTEIKDSGAETPAGDPQPATNSDVNENVGPPASESHKTTSSSESSSPADEPTDDDVISGDSAGEGTSDTPGDDAPSQEVSEPDAESTADESSPTTDVADPDEILAQIGDPVTADDVQRLAMALTEHPATDETLTALDEWADSNDPEIRIAVCEACAEIEDSKAEDILQLLRIDSNDRVMRTAADAM